MSETAKLSPQQVYEAVANRILELLDKGEIPWRKPWRAGWPQNMFSGRPYGLSNAVFLNLAGFGSPYWLTRLQIEGSGGRFREGQEQRPGSVYVVLPPRKYFTSAGEFGRLPHVSGMIKVHYIWNVEQTEGLERCIPKPTETVPLDEAKKVVANNPKPPSMRKNPGGAYYSPVHDFISIQSPSQYKSMEEYYCTLFHELIHSTGHECRLKRKSLEDWSPFDLADYSSEELVAELGAAMLCGLTGLAPLTVENSAGYIQNWLKVLKDDKSFYFKAAAHAQKAANFIRGELATTTQKPGSQTPAPVAPAPQPDQLKLNLSPEDQARLKEVEDRLRQLLRGKENQTAAVVRNRSVPAPNDTYMEHIAEAFDVAEE